MAAAATTLVKRRKRVSGGDVMGQWYWGGQLNDPSLTGFRAVLERLARMAFAPVMGIHGPLGSFLNPSSPILFRLPIAVERAWEPVFAKAPSGYHVPDLELWQALVYTVVPAAPSLPRRPPPA